MRTSTTRIHQHTPHRYCTYRTTTWHLNTVLFLHVLPYHLYHLFSVWFSYVKKTAKVFLYLLSSKSELKGAWLMEAAWSQSEQRSPRGREKIRKPDQRDQRDQRHRGTRCRDADLLLPRGYGWDLWWGATGADAGTQGMFDNVWPVSNNVWHVCLTCLILFLNSHC